MSNGSASMAAGGEGRNPVQLVDRLSTKIVNALHGLFGFQYSRNAEHYVYEVTIPTGSADVAGTTYANSIRITQEADFVSTRLQAGSRILTSGTASLVGAVIGLSVNSAAAGDLPDAPFTLLITDGSTDRQLSNEAIDPMLVYGTFGGLPGVWARPRLFARNTVIGLRLTSLKAVAESTTWSHRVALIGWKIYDATALDLTSRR